MRFSFNNRTEFFPISSSPRRGINTITPISLSSFIRLKLENLKIPFYLLFRINARKFVGEGEGLLTIRNSIYNNFSIIEAKIIDP